MKRYTTQWRKKYKPRTPSQPRRLSSIGMICKAAKLYRRGVSKGDTAALIAAEKLIEEYDRIYGEPE